MFKTLLQNIIHLNSVVACSSGLLTSGILTMLGDSDDALVYGLFAFTATFAVYNGQRLYKSQLMQQTPWLSWVSKYKTTVLVLTSIAGIISAILFFYIWSFSWQGLVVLVASSVISAFYVVRVNGRNLREVPFLKIHLIAGAWVAVLILFPLLNEHLLQHIVVLTCAHYVYVVAVAIPFDIRDLKYDSAHYKTIPQTMGVINAKILAIGLLLVFGTLMLLAFPSLCFNGLFYASVCVQMAYVFYANTKRSDLYFAGGIDGAIGLLGLSYMF